MRKRIVVGVGLALLLATSPALCQDTTHRVETGDTLWDLSEKYWQDANLWPELWSVNPQLHNPHWIYPGALIYLQRPGPDRAARRVVRLPLEKLLPEPSSAAAPGAAEAGSDEQSGTATSTTQGAASGSSIRLARRESLDYVSSHRLPRLGVVNNIHQVKETYGTDEDLEFRVEPDAGLQIGDVVSIFDDATQVLHPVTKQPEGYYVEVLGHLEVLGVVGDRGVGRIIESYQSIGEGAGLMPFRRPLASVQLREAQVGVEGVILRGRRSSNIFADDDVVFLDKGTLHGLESGVVLEVPVREGVRSAQGAVDLGLPLATLVVLTAEDKNAVGLIVSSRAAVESGDLFTAVPFSP
ncbi:MAG: LysM peptidoglycan-binding domain-containing protein [Deferrisomatales bacterium]|nr:LysM peptidoglycan-binding domain-containing protein [Deferrisomatales bacterium]